jgi:plastocyanin
MNFWNALSMLSRVAAVGLLIAFAGCTGAASSGGTAPPAAGPQTWVVATGASSQSEGVQALDYYPNTITIHVGDTVVWNNPTSIPHSISIPQAGHTPPPGRPNQAPVGGPVFDNTAYISSGFLPARSSYAVTFAATGTFAIFCIVHPPEMTGTVVVLPVGAALPASAQENAAAADADRIFDLHEGEAAPLLFPFAPGGPHLAAGISPGLPGTPPSQSAVMRFLDDTTMNQNITVVVGTTVTWTNESNNVPHSVTFPALGQQPPAGSPDQIPPSGGPNYDGTALATSGTLPPNGS